MPGAASTLVAAARDLAYAFDRGGRLYAVGHGRAVEDARHIAVEFLHPVITGKRALPSIVGAERAGPGDVIVGVGYGDAPVEGSVGIAIADHAVPGATHHIELPPDDSFAAKEAALLSYHVLWELVHLFLDARATQTGDGKTLDALYPMLYSNDAGDDDVADAAHRSTEEKLVESASIRERSLTENDAALDRAAELVAAAPDVFTFGNGGSATDAADLAWALRPKGQPLSDDVATVTALANDVGFDVVYARQLATLGRPGDAAIALSTSGTSPNVLAGLAAAKHSGLATIGFAGYDGGSMATAGLDVCCVVRSTSVHRIQESYVTLYDEMVRRAGLGPTG